mmetsp:Transcript_31243/g.90826  ORF Transcript_31243/g.90826 Transcript_31243/m.90826 type:complete len:316 (+) Transcript_31243:367-1314(+)
MRSGASLRLFVARLSSTRRWQSYWAHTTSEPPPSLNWILMYSPQQSLQNPCPQPRLRSSTVASPHTLHVSSFSAATGAASLASGRRWLNATWSISSINSSTNTTQVGSAVGSAGSTTSTSRPCIEGTDSVPAVSPAPFSSAATPKGCPPTVLTSTTTRWPGVAQAGTLLPRGSLGVGVRIAGRSMGTLASFSSSSTSVQTRLAHWGGCHSEAWSIASRTVAGAFLRSSTMPSGVEGAETVPAVCSSPRVSSTRAVAIAGRVSAEALVNFSPASPEAAPCAKCGCRASKSRASPVTSASATMPKIILASSASARNE